MSRKFQYSILCASHAMNGYLPTKNIYYRACVPIIERPLFLYIDYRTDHAFSTLMTKAQLIQPFYCINMITEVL